jgi:hypothetical protein
MRVKKGKLGLASPLYPDRRPVTSQNGVGRGRAGDACTGARWSDQLCPEHSEAPGRRADEEGRVIQRALLASPCPRGQGTFFLPPTAR